MTKTFTRNDVIQFVYNEMTLKESDSFIESIKIDSELKEEYLEQLQLKNNLVRSVISPSTVVVDKILEYSARYQSKVEKISG